MLGTIIGDIIGSTYEFHNPFGNDFKFFPEGSRFTDDSILAIATADALMNDKNYSDYYTKYFKKYPEGKRGWGSSFARQIETYGKLKPYNSYGNGSAMRVSPVGWYAQDMATAISEARKSSVVSHDHIEGIKGAEAIALAVFMAKSGANKEDIIKECDYLFGYATKPLDEYRKRKFDVTCQGTIPVCLAIIKESKDFEDAMKLSIMQGGDVDTNAAIVGGIAEALYGKPPEEFQKKALSLLDKDLRNVVIDFMIKYVPIYSDLEKYKGKN